MTEKRKPARNISPMACVTCGEMFQPYRANQVACSRRCRDAQPHKVDSRKAFLKLPEVKERKNRARRVAVNPERRRAINLAQSLQRYGLTIEQYRDMLTAQGERCALCEDLPKGPGHGASSRLHVDHDHISGVVRALLCNNCNRGIGHLRDDPRLLRTAADYVERHRSDT